MSRVYVNDGYMMLLDAVYFGDKKIGYISEDGLEWGGEEAQFTELNAAQLRTAPVKKVPKKAATNVITFRLIELLPEHCKTVMGGVVVNDKWNAPTGLIVLQDCVKILTGTGQTIEIASALLTAAVRGNLGGDKSLGMDVRMEVVTDPLGDSPFGFSPTVPFVTATPMALSFIPGGESKTVSIDASGPFAILGAVPEGFSVSVVAGKVVVTATENTSGAARGGSIDFALANDSTVKVTVTVTQAYEQ
jgi:hypothetical protein